MPIADNVFVSSVETSDHCVALFIHQSISQSTAANCFLFYEFPHLRACPAFHLNTKHISLSIDHSITLYGSNFFFSFHSCDVAMSLIFVPLKIFVTDFSLAFFRMAGARERVRAHETEAQQIICKMMWKHMGTGWTKKGNRWWRLPRLISLTWKCRRSYSLSQKKLNRNEFKSFRSFHLSVENCFETISIVPSRCQHFFLSV